jgi:hypothetical protein
MANHVKGQEPAKAPLYGAARKRAVQSKKLKATARLYKLFGIIGALLALMLAYSSYSSTLAYAFCVSQRPSGRKKRQRPLRPEMHRKKCSMRRI